MCVCVCGERERDRRKETESEHTYTDQLRIAIRPASPHPSIDDTGTSCSSVQQLHMYAAATKHSFSPLSPSLSLSLLY